MIPLNNNKLEFQGRTLCSFDLIWNYWPYHFCSRKMCTYLYMFMNIGFKLNMIIMGCMTLRGKNQWRKTKYLTIIWLYIQKTLLGYLICVAQHNDITYNPMDTLWWLPISFNLNSIALEMFLWYLGQYMFMHKFIVIHVIY
jgi:hypothetical protein